jgi:hypothetical protein
MALSGSNQRVIFGEPLRAKASRQSSPEGSTFTRFFKGLDSLKSEKKVVGG